ncbi:acyltransferase family protein [Photobacterium atrarenae]|uniref:Acyltransferase family protein n=1 Tax=Photobacterium atrarenae TaxID=865757 RepID=A0ABY5GBL4_9GAMM|nr:acyltransferase family protein [Photobacterium atrarenae]UTV26565.1 acyltransferase family protein [Photobacterium atrarenae]
MQRIHAFDSVKFLAIIAVFVIHYMSFYGYGGEEQNAIYLSLNILARFAVPFFFVAAGYLYYFRSQSDSGQYTLRYVSKLIRMYLIWTLFYLLVVGLGYQNWQSFSWLAALYHGTLGFEIMWFMTALIITISLLYLAQRFQVTTPLLLIACMLHAIGLTGQSYQVLLPVELFNPQTNTFLTNSRDPLFFGLFYLMLGYQLARSNAVRWIARAPWPTYLLATLIFSALSVAEGLWLIRRHGSTSADYYLMTIPVTLALTALVLTRPTTTSPSVLAKLGTHSGEIYLNHGVLNTLVMSLFWYMGAYSNPEVAALIFDNLALQLLLVPAALGTNFFLYFSIRKLFGAIFGRNLIIHWREPAMMLCAYWLLFLLMGDSQGELRFNHRDPVTILQAIIGSLAAYLAFVYLLMPTSGRCGVDFRNHILVPLLTAVYWLMLAWSGAIQWLLAFHQLEASPVVQLLSGPVFCFCLLAIVSVAMVLGLQKWCYQITADHQAASSYGT